MFQRFHCVSYSSICNMNLGNRIKCVCGRLLKFSSVQSNQFLLHQNVPFNQSSRGMMTITEVRQDLAKMVGYASSYSDAKPDRSNLHSYLVDNQSELKPRLMTDSKHSVVIPLSKKDFREKYMNAHNTVRFGQLLENLDTLAVSIAYQHNAPMITEHGVLLGDIDLLAGYVAYRHCQPSILTCGISPLSIVTAMVDEVTIHRNNIDPTQDIIMTGHVTWSGKSSLEIEMKLTQENLDVLDAQFVMVARDPESKKSAIVHPLQPVTDEEIAIFEKGNQNKIRRLTEAKESLFETSPSAEESKLVHDLFQSTLDSKSKSFHTHVLPKGSVWLESTKLKNCIICFPERRNIHYKIFGGFLMRKGFELGWANACVFSKQVPRVVGMDDIIFHCPVPVGSLLLMSSQVNYVEGNHFSCRIHAEVLDPITGISRTSNVFHLVFTCDASIPEVIPKTYGESMLYLDGRRRLKSRKIPAFM